MTGAPTGQIEAAVKLILQVGSFFSVFRLEKSLGNTELISHRQSSTTSAEAAANAGWWSKAPSSSTNPAANPTTHHNHRNKPDAVNLLQRDNRNAGGASIM